MPFDPPDAIVRQILMGSPPDAEDISDDILSYKTGLQVEHKHTLAHLYDQLARAVKLREWDIATQMEETLSIAKEQLEEAEASIRKL